MLTVFLRDQLFTVAWFGLMTSVWLGWAQEDPPQRWRVWLGVGSSLGLLLAAGFGVLTGLNWDGETALEGRYPWFGVLVAVEVLAAGAGCWLLARRGLSRWMAWWVAVVVAAHFLPLAWLLRDAGTAVLGALALVALVALLPRLRSAAWSTSRLVGPVLGGLLLAYAALSAVVVAIRA